MHTERLFERRLQLRRQNQCATINFIIDQNFHDQTIPVYLGRNARRGERGSVAVPEPMGMAMLGARSRDDRRSLAGGGFGDRMEGGPFLQGRRPRALGERCLAEVPRVSPDGRPVRQASGRRRDFYFLAGPGSYDAIFPDLRLKNKDLHSDDVLTEWLIRWRFGRVSAALNPRVLAWGYDPLISCENSSSAPVRPAGVGLPPGTRRACFNRSAVVVFEADACTIYNATVKINSVFNAN